jgi:hypothetical protein
MVPDSSQPQFEQAHNTTFNPDTQEQQTGHVAPFMSRIEQSQRQKPSWLITVETMICYLVLVENDLKEQLGGIELTEQQQQQVIDVFRQYLIVVRENLDKAVIAVSS